MKNQQNRKILAIAHQIGGANAISPVIQKLNCSENFFVSVIGYGVSAKGFSNYNIKFHSPEEYRFINQQDILRSAKEIIQYEYNRENKYCI